MTPSSNLRKLATLLIASLLYLGLKSILPSAEVSANNGVYYVQRVIDGDTLKLSSGERVRLIGVDTPEVHYSNKLLADSKRNHQDIRTIQGLGRKASIFTKGLCLHKKVRLEFDVEKRDRYNRLLAYVYLDDGTFVNAVILKEGYGQVMTIPPNVKHADYFSKLQKEARENKKGLWK